MPGLAQEASKICEKLDIESCDVTSLGKEQFRKYATQACHVTNGERLRDQAEGKQKCDGIGGEDYVKKPFVSDKKIEDVQNIY